MFNNQERRENKRIVKPITASFRIRSDEARKTETNDWYSVNLTNLSTGGTFFYYKKDLGIGSVLDLKIDVHGFILIINCVGKVIRIDKPKSTSMYSIAIKFLDIGEQEKEAINTTVEEALEHEDQIAMLSTSHSNIKTAGLIYKKMKLKN